MDVERLSVDGHSNRVEVSVAVRITVREFCAAVSHHCTQKCRNRKTTMEHRHRHHSPSVLDILLSFTLLLILSTLPRMTPPTTILGAGLTGLTTAYRLSTLGVSPIVVLEKSGRIGGWVDSRKVKVQLPNGKEMKEQEQEQEVLLETGPRSIRPRGGVGAARMLRLVSVGLVLGGVGWFGSSPLCYCTILWSHPRLQTVSASSRPTISNQLTLFFSI